MNQFKYIHVLWQGDVLFNKRIIAMINDTDNGFNIDQHMFVTPYEHIFDEIKMFRNVIFETHVKPQSAALINKYAVYGDWIFLHGMCGLNEALKIKKKYQKKIVWRTWGHDTGLYQYKKHDPIRNLAKWFLNCQWKQEVRRFRLVGGANVVDEIALRKTFGKLLFKEIDYPAKDNMQLLNAHKKEISKERDILNILVGHSGMDNDNHFQIINRLKKFYGENIKLIFVLSYGDAAYIKRLKTYIQENCAKQAKIIEQIMPLDAYVKMLSDIDVAIMDGEKSYALSNIGILLFFGKKIILNRKGILAEAFRQEGIPCRYTDELDDMTIEELAEKIDYPEQQEISLIPVGYEKAVVRWKALLEALN